MLKIIKRLVLFSSRTAPRHSVPQLPGKPWTTTFCYATLPHCNGRQTGAVLCISWQLFQHHRNHSPVLEHSALPHFFLHTYFLELWPVWVVSGLSERHTQLSNIRMGHSSFSSLCGEKKEKERKKSFLWLLLTQIMLYPLCYISIQDSFKRCSTAKLCSSRQMWGSECTNSFTSSKTPPVCNALTEFFLLQFSYFVYILTCIAMLWVLEQNRKWIPSAQDTVSLSFTPYSSL